MRESECPSNEAISAYLAGVLRPGAHEEIESHLETCEACLSTIESLRGLDDALNNALRRYAENATAELGVDDPEVRRALEAVAQLAGQSACGDLSTTVAGRRVVEEPATAPGPLGESATLGPGVPDRLGNYELGEKLGAGGMGAVYRARHARLKREVAVKVLRTERTANPAAVARFEREMEAVGRLDHPNVVRATDGGVHDGVHFLVMELIDGADLTRMVRAKGPMPIAEACEAVRQAARALEHAHQAGLVHRDVKPSNLILTTKGVVKLADLGLARLHGEQIEETGLTAHGHVMGTADFIAPEQVLDAHHVDGRADVYSLGCTLYYLLAGRAPFADFSHPMQKMLAHTEKAMPGLDSYRPDAPAGLLEIVRKLTARDRNDRFATPAEVVDALAPFAEGADLADWMHRPATDTELAARYAPAPPTPSGRPSLDMTLSDPPPRSRSRRAGYVLLALLVGGLALGAALPQLMVRIKDKAGNTVAEVPLPDGGNVEIVAVPATPNGVPPAVPTPSAVPKPPVVRADASAVETTDPLHANAWVARPTRLPNVKRWTIAPVRPRSGITMESGRAGVRQFQVHPKLPLAVVSDHGAQLVRVYELPTFKLLAVVPGSERPLSMAWSPDGEQFAHWSGGLGLPMVTWHWRRGQRTADCYPRVDGAARDGLPRGLGWSLDGKFLLGSAGRFQLETRTFQPWRDGQPENPVASLADPRGRFVANLFDDGGLRVWNGATGELHAESKPPIPEASQRWLLAVSPDGRRALTDVARDVPDVAVWDTGTGARIGTLVPGRPTWGPISAGWSENGDSIVVGYAGAGGLLAGFAWPEGDVVWTHSDPALIDAVTVAPTHDAGWGVAGASGELVLLDGAGQPTARLARPPAVQLAGWTPDHTGLFIAQSSADLPSAPILRQLDLASGRLLPAPETIPWSSDAFLSEPADCDRLGLVTRIAGRPTAAILDARTRTLIARQELPPEVRLEGYPHHHHCVLRGGDTPDLLVIHDDRQSILWDPGQRRFEALTKIFGDQAGTVAWSPDRRQLAVKLGEQGVRIVRSEDFTEIARTPKLDDLLPTRLQWSPDGGRLALCDEYAHWAVFEPATGRLTRFRFHDLEVYSAPAWSADGKRLFGFTRRRWQRFWMWAPGAEPGRPVEGRWRETHAQKLAPDANAWAELTLDESIELRTLDDFRVTGRIARFDADRAVMISPEGHIRSVGDVAHELVYVVETNVGVRTYTPTEFAERFGWKNDPDRVRPLPGPARPTVAAPTR